MSSLPHLTLALAVIVVAALLAGRVSLRLAQPRVIGEVLAGLALGPTALGAASPHLFHTLFGAAVLSRLNTLSWLGIVVFVFFVGVESSRRSPGRARLIAAVAAGGFVVPLLAGMAVAFPLSSTLRGGAASQSAFTLFLGVALGITALPVLAAILDDLGLSSTAVGRLALGTAVTTDVAAWCLLAIVAALARSAGWLAAAGRLGVALALALVVLGVVRPALRRAFSASQRAARYVHPLAGIALAIGLAAATDRIGVSFVLGAFLAGLAVGEQPGEGRRLLAGVRRTNRLLLLPVFFTTTGLRIDLGSSLSGALLAAGAIVVAVGTAGKVAGVLLGARRGGLPWRESFTLGFLLNTKGLTELVVLRLGYDLGLITRAAFGVLVVAALVMTAATTPLLQAIGATRGAASPRSSPRRDGEAVVSAPP